MSSPDTILMRLTAAAVALLRHRHDVPQQTVDAVPDPQVAGLRLDVHVARAGPHGVGEHDVDQPDDRCGVDGRWSTSTSAVSSAPSSSNIVETPAASSDSDQARARWSRTWLPVVTTTTSSAARV